VNFDLPRQLSSRIVIFTACLLELGSCGTKRPIARGPHASRPPLLAATKTDLLQRVTAFYDSIHSLKIKAGFAGKRL
jgi:hypothetical protein